ncbi:MAG: vWA domain-containing protein [Terriglobia bacterium]
MAQLTGTTKPSPDGGTVLLVERGVTGKIKTKLQVALAGVQGFTDRALTTKMVGIVLFGSTAQLYHTASHDKKALRNAITSIENHPLSGGSTNLADALALFLDGKYPFVETVLVVTDGKPDNAITALDSGKLLKDKGTEILVIGTEDADWAFLEKLRSRPDLSVRTSNEGLEQAITDASKLLKP